jgi:hypothetical protein
MEQRGRPPATLRWFARLSNKTQRSDRRNRLTATTLHPKPTYSISSAVFKYQPLRLPSQEIRLLRRLDDRNGQPSFEIFHVLLMSAPAYIALSYCWDHDDPAKQSSASPAVNRILLGGKPFKVGLNLHAALANNCIPMGAYAWIDAICINQSDLSEKGHQVAGMREIFGGKWARPLCDRSTSV